MSAKDEIRSRPDGAGPPSPARAGRRRSGNRPPRARLGIRLADGGKRTFAAYLGVGSEPPTLPPWPRCTAPATGYCFRSANRPGAELGVLDSRPPSLSAAATPPSRSLSAPVRYLRHARRGRDLPAATALDRDGNRIGQGGGYYDKFLAALGDLPWGVPVSETVPLPTAAIVYDAEVLAAGSIPAESFDRKVAAALTPGGLIRLSALP